MHEDFDNLIEEAKMAERRALERGTGKSKKVARQSLRMNQAPQTLLNWSTKKEAKKKSKKGAQVASSLGEVKALFKELKEVKREAVRRKVFYSQCKVEGHLKEECMTPPICAICIMYYNHTIAN